MNNNLVERDIFQEVVDHLESSDVTVIIGPRQTGKTTLLNQLTNYLLNNKNIRENQIKSFNLDLISDLQTIGDQTNFIRFVKEELIRSKFIYAFIDEVQRLENPGQFLKGVFDLKLPLKLIVTGSSSLEIRSKIFESLTGRKRVFRLDPFSFHEYLKSREPSLLKLLDQNLISTTNQDKIMAHLYEYLEFGGYPRVVQTIDKDEKIKILNEIYSSYLEKDIVNFLSIKNHLAFSKMVSLLADQVGNLVNLQEISNTLGMNLKTVEHYLFTLSNTFIIDLVRPYFTNPRSELTKMPKVFFIDNGIRNLALKYFVPFEKSPSKGQMLENFVNFNLNKNLLNQVNYWRTKGKSEVDFVWRNLQGDVVPIEVKASEMNKATISRSFRSFIEKYKPKTAYVINLKLQDKLVVDKTQVQFILPYELMSRLISNLR